VLEDQHGAKHDIHCAVTVVPGTPTRIQTWLDITRLKNAEKGLRAALQATHDIIESSPIGIYVTNAEGQVEYANPAMLSIAAITAEQSRVLNVLLLPEYQQLGLAAKIRSGLAGEPFRLTGVEITSSLSQKKTIRNFIGVPYEQAGERKLLMFVEDVTSQAARERELSHLASHDALTRLPNRALFEDRAGMALARARRTKNGAAVMLLDLDRFKNINDTLGHDVGDTVLKATAKRLTTALRGVDTVARLGGDEFLLLVTDVNSPQQADRLAERLLKAVREPLALEKQRLEVTASIGIAVFPEDGDRLDELMRRADFAMYAAKHNGRNQYAHRQDGP
jgi:two-component system, chemotaxis family, CheB/CheR fusion protein